MLKIEKMDHDYIEYTYEIFIIGSYRILLKILFKKCLTKK